MIIMITFRNILLLLFLSIWKWSLSSEQNEWHTNDAFDEIRAKMNNVNSYDCDSTYLNGDLYLPEDSVVSHHPDMNEKDYNNAFSKRSSILTMQNILKNRAFFWSYILQSHLNHPANDESYDPGMMYYFLSSVADLSTNSHISASSIYFSPNMAFSSSYNNFFNKTLARFAPRAIRSTETQFSVNDLGVLNPEFQDEDYTSDEYRINEWYGLWLPNKTENQNGTLAAYETEITYASNKTKIFTFYGPPENNEALGPVKWSRPYFDCGRINKWLVAAASPVVDIYPRHTQHKDIEHPSYTAAVVVEMDYEKIDINQCPLGHGNDGPNRFASTARCKESSTECVPLPGWGFQRGGYQCRCRSGFHLPSTVRQPYLDEEIERVDQIMYNTSFDCDETKSFQQFPERGQRVPPSTRTVYMNQYSEYVNAVKGRLALDETHINIHEVLNYISHVQRKNCHKYHWTDLILPKKFSYGAEEQFENQARMAVRLANFISAFLQVTDNEYGFNGGNSVPDKYLTEDQMFGETLALMFGDSKILNAGILWDRNKFSNRTFFAPFAYQTNMKSRKLKIEDLARNENLNEMYTHKPWFEVLKQRWSTTHDYLERFLLKMRFRGEEQGASLKRFDRYPTYYRAAKLEHGHWSNAYFDCRGYLKQWMVTYAVPFFGRDSYKTKMEFKGVVAVTMSLLSLDINQCYSNPRNVFKLTNKCDKETMDCVPLYGHGYQSGGYKCDCKQGYEYPYEGPNSSFAGQLLETELRNVIADRDTRIDMLKCRPISTTPNGINQTQTENNINSNSSMEKKN